MSNDQSSATRAGFHSVKVTGDDYGNAVTVTELVGGETLTTITPRSGAHLQFPKSNVVELRPGQDVTRDPKFLGDAPEKTRKDGCTLCKRRWGGHFLNGVNVSARAFHRFDVSGGGYFDDELAQGQR